MKTANPGTCRPITNDGYAPWPTPNRTCRTCGTAMHMLPAGNNDWAWRALDGSHKGNSPDAPVEYLRDPGAWWGGLAELMQSKDVHVSTRAAQTYSDVKAFIGIYGVEPWAHWHSVDADGAAPPDRRCPDCCGRPMHAQPKGWVCRKSGLCIPYEDHGPSSE